METGSALMLKHFQRSTHQPGNCQQQNGIPATEALRRKPDLLAKASFSTTRTALTKDSAATTLCLPSSRKLINNQDVILFKVSDIMNRLKGIEAELNHPALITEIPTTTLKLLNLHCSSEANRSGDLDEATSRIPWRGDSGLNDGDDDIFSRTLIENSN